MILDLVGASFYHEGVTYTVGSQVVATEESDYEGLFGTITEIRTGDDRETENDTPDIYCEFMPPVVPHEIEALQDRFSRLYGGPKTVEDIALDMVIMAPEMIRVMDPPNSHNLTIYIVKEEWTLNGDSSYCRRFAADYDHAKLLFDETIRKDMDDGCISQWIGSVDLEQESAKDHFKCWLRDAYFENHYEVSITEETLPLCAEVFQMIGKSYVHSQFRAQLVEQIECWEEIGGLTEAQFAELIAQPYVPEMIQKSLEQHGYLEEAYWEAFSEAAFKIVQRYIQSAGGRK